VAQWCGANRTTVQRWHKGVSRIDPRAAARLDDLENKMAVAVEQATAVAREQKPDVVELIRYRDQASLDASPNAAGLPLGAHAMMIGWLSDALEDKGYEVTIRWAA
jgi:hypothetical protein